MYLQVPICSTSVQPTRPKGVEEAPTNTCTCLGPYNKLEARSSTHETQFLSLCGFDLDHNRSLDSSDS